MARAIVFVAVAIAGILSVLPDVRATPWSPTRDEHGVLIDPILERGSCWTSSTAELWIWHEWKHGERTIEWLTTAGPTAPGGPPSFRCLRILASYADGFEVSEWCVPLGAARVSWTIEQGTPPFRVSIDDHDMGSGRGYVDIPCELIQDRYGSGDSSQHEIVTLQVTAQDAEGRSSTSSSRLGLASAAPSQRIDRVGILPGLRDVHFVPEPWPFQFKQYISESLAGIVAIVRYRALGESEWKYVTPLPAPAQSSCGYLCKRSHVSNLEPDQTYDVQAAWMWNDIYSSIELYTGSPWWEDEAVRDNWWRSWTTPEMLH